MDLRNGYDVIFSISDQDAWVILLLPNCLWI